MKVSPCVLHQPHSVSGGGDGGARSPWTEMLQVLWPHSCFPDTTAPPTMTSFQGARFQWEARRSCIAVKRGIPLGGREESLLSPNALCALQFEETRVFKSPSSVSCCPHASAPEVGSHQTLLKQACADQPGCLCKTLWSPRPVPVRDAV